MRAGRISVSHAAAGASKPSSNATAAGTASGSCQPRLVGHPLPVEQKAQEVTRGDRFDLRAQTTDRVVMDAREQSPITPFVDVGAWREAAAQGEALGLQREQRRLISSGSSPSGAASAPGVTGPSPSSRPRRTSVKASSWDQLRNA